MRPTETRGEVQTARTGSVPLLDELAAALTELLPPGPATEAVLEQARERGERLAKAAQVDAAGAVAAATFTADVLAGLWLERAWSAEEIDALLERAADLTGFPPPILRVAVYLGLPKNHHVLELPPRLGIEAILGMLLRFAPVSEASVWATSAEGALDCRLSLNGEPGRRSREVARDAIAEGTATGSRSLLHGVAVSRWGESHAALVVRARPEERDEALAYATETATALGPLLEAETLLERNAAREQSLVGASERRLVRIGADIHDGPLQEIAALGSELQLFRSQLEQVLAASPNREIVVGRVDDVHARLVALDDELRELSRSLESPGIMAVPFEDLVEGEVQAFRGRSGLTVDLELRGRFEPMTASQRIALLRVIREALQNVHDHSGAGAARVGVDATRPRLRAEIVDEGSGFDVERRLVDAARAGRLGLVGMGERVRLLGGRLDIDSRPGGPTTVSATVPRWQPPQNDAEGG